VPIHVAATGASPMSDEAGQTLSQQAGARPLEPPPRVESVACRPETSALVLTAAFAGRQRLQLQVPPALGQEDD